MNPWDVCGAATHNHHLHKEEKNKKKHTPKTEILNNNKMQMLTIERINEIFFKIKLEVWKLKIPESLNNNKMLTTVFS